VKNALRVASSEQSVLDNALANRIVEFESSSAILTPAGRAVLDDMGIALKKIAGQRVEIIGHTDSSGVRSSNLVLSQARADAVKNYLLTKGLMGEYLSTTGAGSDQPVADNSSVEGRARNRRIEFRINN
jgi:OOP family OmpA-OmpF porin